METETRWLVSQSGTGPEVPPKKLLDHGARPCAICAEAMSQALLRAEATTSGTTVNVVQAAVEGLDSALARDGLVALMTLSALLSVAVLVIGRTADVSALTGLGNGVTAVETLPTVLQFVACWDAVALSAALKPATVAVSVADTDEGMIVLIVGKAGATLTPALGTSIVEAADCRAA